MYHQRVILLGTINVTDIPQAFAEMCITKLHTFTCDNDTARLNFQRKAHTKHMHRSPPPPPKKKKTSNLGYSKESIDRQTIEGERAFIIRAYCVNTKLKE